MIIQLDALNISERLRYLLPKGWFGGATPVLDALLLGFAKCWIVVLDLLSFCSLQTRLLTCQGFWLDLFCNDFFGSNLSRISLESDASFRTRVASGLIQDRCTRKALADGIYRSSGSFPQIFEPLNPGDTGCYTESNSNVTAGYGLAGRWGGSQMAFQALVTVSRPTVAGFSGMNGWRYAAGGFGTGDMGYAAGRILFYHVTDEGILSQILHDKPAASTIWVRFV